MLNFNQTIQFINKSNLTILYFPSSAQFFGDALSRQFDKIYLQDQNENLFKYFAEIQPPVKVASAVVILTVLVALEEKIKATGRASPNQTFQGLVRVRLTQ